MKLLLIFVTILVAGSFSQQLEEESETSLCVEHQNPFKYAHCIKKRDTGCQNGGFCGTCNSNSCQTCNGNNCRTTCNGQSCNQCPNGNCCDGQNCNVCSGRSCCTSSCCNSCVNSCSSGCSTPACRSSCFQTCQGSCCCDRSECFQSCRNQCIGDHCYETCARQCSCTNCDNPSNPSVPNVQPIYINVSSPVSSNPPRENQTIIVVNKPQNSNPVNVTTIVNLKNYISNKNIINNPINITNVNHNHFNQTQPEPLPEPIKQKCCIVVYPVHCYDITEPPYKKCIQKRERKCGEICTSVVVHVVHVPGKDREVQVPYPVPVPIPGPTQVQVVKQPEPYPVPVPGPVQVVKQFQQVPIPVPVVQRYPVYLNSYGYRPICHYTNRYPWISCMNYGTQSCGSCYVCGGQYNPTVCRQQLNCPGLCRGGIVNFPQTWQDTILRYASSYNTPYATQPRAVPDQQLQQQGVNVVDNQQVVQDGQQPVLYQGAYPQQVQQPLDIQQAGGQQFVAQQPYEIQQAGAQVVGGQTFDVQQPLQGIQQQYIVPQPYQMLQAGQQPDIQQQQQQQQQQQPAGVGYQ